MLSSLAVGLLLLLGAAVAAGNWAAAFASIRNRRAGIDRHVSPIPLVAQFLVALAAMVARWADVTWAPQWLYWAVALLDVSLWSLVHLPFFLLWQGLRRVTRRAD